MARLLVKNSYMKKILFYILLFAPVFTNGQVTVGDTIVYVYSEQYEDMVTADLDFLELINNWAFAAEGYPYINADNYNTIEDVGSPYNNVWKARIPAGNSPGCDDGIVSNYQLNLNGEYDELYYSYDLYANSDFNSNDATTTAGKMIFGVSGGNGVFNTSSGGTWVLDSTASRHTGNGFKGHGIFGTNNRQRGYYYTQDAAGNQLSEMTTVYIPAGVWKSYTVRVKMNDYGKENGIFEVYEEGVLVGQDTTCKWSSMAQLDYSVRNKITGLVHFFFFGGGGCDYANIRENYIQYDNISVYYYLPGASQYKNRSRTYGDEIEQITPYSSDINILVSDVLFDSIFTKAIDTIQSSYRGMLEPPAYHNLVTTEIVRDTFPITLTPLFFQDGFNYSGSPERQMYVKVYSGIGEGKVLLHNWQDGLGGPTEGVDYVINDSLATIEYYPGSDLAGGFEFAYFSPGEDISPPEPPILPPVVEVPLINGYNAKIKGYRGVLLKWPKIY